MSLFKKTPPKPEPVKSNTLTDDKGKFRQFAYILAWVAFLSTVGSALFNVLKAERPPDKDEYYK